MKKWLATSTVLPTILSTTTSSTTTTTIPDQVSGAKLKATSNPPTQARHQNILNVCNMKKLAKLRRWVNFEKIHLQEAGYT